MIHLGGVEISGHVGRGFLAEADFVEPGLLEQPVLVAALLPLGDVIGREVFALLPESLNDVRVGEAVEEPLVELVALGFGQARDFAVAAVGERCGRGRGRFSRGQVSGVTFSRAVFIRVKKWSDLLRFSPI